MKFVVMWVWVVLVFWQNVGLSAPTLRLLDTEVSNGQVLVFEILTGGEGVSHLDVSYHQRSLPLMHLSSKASQVLLGCLPISYESGPSEQVLLLKWQEHGQDKSKVYKFRVISGAYQKETLTVDSKRVFLSARDKARAARDKKEVSEIQGTPDKTQWWAGAFMMPINSSITSPFGVQRVYNGQLKSVHMGLDLRAPTGTVVKTTQAGRVRLAKSLFYGGNVVMVDHGKGFFSSYAHLSRIEVSVGQKVTKGQRIGLSGATGRVSGPHLHWTLSFDGIVVSPLHFIQRVNPLFEATHSEKATKKG